MDYKQANKLVRLQVVWRAKKEMWAQHHRGSSLCGGDTATSEWRFERGEGSAMWPPEREANTWVQPGVLAATGGLCGVSSSLEGGQEIKNFREKAATEISLDEWISVCQGQSGSLGPSTQWAEMWNASWGWEPGRAHVLEGFISHNEKFGLYPKGSGQTLQHFGWQVQGDHLGNG